MSTKNHKISFASALLLCLFCSQLQAQQSFNVCSGRATVGSTQHFYSIGEMVLVNTAHSAQLIVTQGFHQPDRKSESNGNQENVTGGSMAFASLVKVFPNPANDHLFVQTDLPVGAGIECTLYDASGRRLFQHAYVQSAGSNQWPFDFRLYAAGQYFLNVTSQADHQQAVSQTFNIQKR